METITIEGKTVGQRRPLFPEWQTPLPGAAEGLTLRALLEQVVRAEVAAFRERREARRLTQVLSREQIEAGAARGKVDAGGRDLEEADADPDQAVEAALLAFQDGLYYVFIDDEHATDLDAEVRLRAGSRVTFLRLVALAGG